MNKQYYRGKVPETVKQFYVLLSCVSELSMAALVKVEVETELGKISFDLKMMVMKKRVFELTIEYGI